MSPAKGSSPAAQAAAVRQAEAQEAAAKREADADARAKRVAAADARRAAAGTGKPPAKKPVRKTAAPPAKKPARKTAANGTARAPVAAAGKPDGTPAAAKASKTAAAPGKPPRRKRKAGANAEVQAEDATSVSSFDSGPPKKGGGMRQSEGKPYADFIEERTNKSFKDCGDRVALVRRVKLITDTAPKTILITDVNRVDFFQCKWCGWMSKPSTCSKHTYKLCPNHPWNPRNNRLHAGNEDVDKEEVAEEKPVGEGVSV